MMTSGPPTVAGVTLTVTRLLKFSNLSLSKARWNPVAIPVISNVGEVLFYCRLNGKFELVTHVSVGVSVSKMTLVFSIKTLSFAPLLACTAISMSSFYLGLGPYVTTELECPRRQIRTIGPPLAQSFAFNKKRTRVGPFASASRATAR